MELRTFIVVALSLNAIVSQKDPGGRGPRKSEARKLPDARGEVNAPDGSFRAEKAVAEGFATGWRSG